MDDDRNLHIDFYGDDGAGGDLCRIQSHSDCNGQECEIHRTVGNITRAEIILTVVWSVLAFGVSALFALGAFALHCWQVFHAKPAPDFPLWMLGIIGAPYAGKLLIHIVKRVQIKSRSEE